MTANNRRLFLNGSADEVRLEDIASMAGMQLLDVAHSCWPLGLLVDAEGDAWRVGSVSGSPPAVPIVLADPTDLLAELVRLLGPWVKVHDEPPEDMPGLVVPQLRYASLPSLRRKVVLSVAKSVAVLATLQPARSIENDTGRVLRLLERAGALLASDL